MATLLINEVDNLENELKDLLSECKRVQDEVNEFKFVSKVRRLTYQELVNQKFGK